MISHPEWHLQSPSCSDWVFIKTWRGREVNYVEFASCLSVPRFIFLYIADYHWKSRSSVSEYKTTFNMAAYEDTAPHHNYRGDKNTLGDWFNRHDERSYQCRRSIHSRWGYEGMASHMRSCLKCKRATNIDISTPTLCAWWVGWDKILQLGKENLSHKFTI